MYNVGFEIPMTGIFCRAMGFPTKNPPVPDENGVHPIARGTAGVVRLVSTAYELAHLGEIRPIGFIRAVYQTVSTERRLAFGFLFPKN